jgi:hypothetical protein
MYSGGAAMSKELFFFEKKNPKTSGHCATVCHNVCDSTAKSLFASFSSEKEESLHHRANAAAQAAAQTVPAPPAPAPPR